jgi:inosine-uridine nucleoside N-ribohydrolase
MLWGGWLAAISAAAAADRTVIMDQDAFGGVNLQPMLMVIQSPGVRVAGITVESGDGWEKESAAQTLRMLELIGRTDIPVAGGATFPLINSQEETRRWERLYGTLPYKGAWMEAWPGYNTVNRPHYHAPEIVPPLPQGMPATSVVAESAAEFLVRTVRAHPGEISILAMGPCTNLALAVQRDPQFAADAKELVMMGGSFNPDASRVDEFSRQFINSPRVEFNFRWDPEAARIVLHAPWRRMVLVPTDATVGTRMTTALAHEAGSGATTASRYFAAYGDSGYPMWDETGASVWLEPSIVRESDELLVDVDIDHGADYGATLSWYPGFNPGLGERRLTVVRKIDIHRLERLFVARVTGQAPLP